MKSLIIAERPADGSSSFVPPGSWQSRSVSQKQDGAPVQVTMFIDVLSVKENATDIRCLLKKDQHGLWNITSWPVRVAANNSPVTSTVTGSRVYPLDEGLKICGLSVEEILSVKKKCLEFLTLFLEALETEFGPFGEIGIDLAVDKNYNLWYLECNANPAKTATKIAGTEEEKRLSLVYPLRYARYLAGFEK